MENYEKKYNKLVEAIKQLQKANPFDEGIQNWVKDNVPELAESESGDERIRKEILDHCKDKAEKYSNDPKYKNISAWIAWLEKQKEPELSEDFGEYVAELSKQFPEVSFAKLSRIAVRVKNWLEKQELKSNPYSGISFEYNGHTWGMCARDGGVEILMDSELKAFVSLDKSFVYPTHPQPDFAPKSTLKAINEEKVDNQICVKSADKIKPKFKVGDNIRRKTPSFCDKDMQVARIEKDYYICNHIGKFSSEVVPFSKESSYELIEQKPAWSEEDEVKINRIVSLLENLKVAENDILLKDIDWLKSLKQRIGG